MSAQIEKYSWTAKAFKEHLATIPDDWVIIFSVDGIPLRFGRAKIRGETLIQLEFEETAEYPLKSRK
jgi:hypothetical protein